MGLFRSSKPPPGPLPTIIVYISTPADKIFKPNDLVTGYVSLRTPVPLNPEAVEVSFYGTSSVWLRTSSSRDNSTDYTHYRDNAPLFDIKVNLLGKHSPPAELQELAKKGKEEASEWKEQQQEHMLIPGEIYNYPFEFRVPGRTAFNRSGFYKSDTEESWTIHPHNLPPSMLYGKAKNSPDNAYIEYGIRSRLLSPGIGTSKDAKDPISDTATILFAPPNLPTSATVTVIRSLKTFTFTSSTLTGQAAETIGFRQSIRDRFSKETPKLTFEHALEVPDHLTSGAEFRLKSTLTALDRSEHVSTIPAITLTVLKLDILEYTFLRAPRDSQASNTMSGWRYKDVSATEPQGPYPDKHGGQDTVFHEDKVSLNSVPASQTVELGVVETETIMAVVEKEKEKDQKHMMEQMTSSSSSSSCSEVWFSARVPGFTVPSFVSWAITRCYRVKVKMGIEIGGKKFEHVVDSVVNSMGSNAP